MSIMPLHSVFNKTEFISNLHKFTSPRFNNLFGECSLIYFVSNIIRISFSIAISEPVIPHAHLKEFGEEYRRELAAGANQPYTREKSAIPHKRLGAYQAPTVRWFEFENE